MRRPNSRRWGCREHRPSEMLFPDRQAGRGETEIRLQEWEDREDDLTINIVQ